jgi:hypothetical protein
MKTLPENISIQKLLVASDITATTSGTGVDTYGTEPEKFDSALVIANIGAITGTPTSVKVKIEESEVSNFGSGVTVAPGGEEVTVVASTQYSFQVARTKRYLRVTCTIAGGTTPHVILSSDAIFTNWATPFPTV